MSVNKSPSGIRIAAGSQYLTWSAQAVVGAFPIVVPWSNLQTLPSAGVPFAVVPPGIVAFQSGRLKKVVIRALVASADDTPWVILVNGVPASQNLILPAGDTQAIFDVDVPINDEDVVSVFSDDDYSVKAPPTSILLASSIV